MKRCFPLPCFAEKPHLHSGPPEQMSAVTRILFPVIGRRGLRGSLELTVKHLQRFKPAFSGDLLDRKIFTGEKTFRHIQTEFQQILMRTRPEFLFEQLEKIRTADSGKIRHIIRSDARKKMFVQIFNRFPQRCRLAPVRKRSGIPGAPMQNRITICSEGDRIALAGMERAERFGTEMVQRLYIVPESHPRNGTGGRTGLKMKNLATVRIFRRCIPDCLLPRHMPENCSASELAPFSIDFKKQSPAGQKFHAFRTERNQYRYDISAVRSRIPGNTLQFYHMIEHFSPILDISSKEAIFYQFAFAQKCDIIIPVYNTLR